MDTRLKMVAAAAAGVLATLAAGAAAMATRDHSLGPLGWVDTNNDGKVTRAEWLAAANARFSQIDRNGDGTLIVGELPPPRLEHGPGRHDRHHGPRDEWDDGDDAPPPPAIAPLTDQPAAATPNVSGK